jgi:hypothetical protein
MGVLGHLEKDGKKFFVQNYWYSAANVITAPDQSNTHTLINPKRNKIK